jgi:hypothetical protein
MVYRAKITADWLRKGRMIDDLTILRHLIADSTSWNIDTAKLDQELFQREFDLPPLPKKTVSNDTIDRTIGYEQLYPETDRTLLVPPIPFGNSVESQVASLLPSTLSEEEREIFSYVFSRFVVEETPSENEWPLVPKGLDSLSAALFTIYNISHLVEGTNLWLKPLWQLRVEQYQLSCLQEIYDLLVSDKKIEDVIEAIESIRISINQLLIQNKKFDTSDKPQAPLCNKISVNWIQTLSADRKNPKRDVDVTRREIAAEVREDIMFRKGGTRSEHSNDYEFQVLLQPMTLTKWNIHSMRPDGPPAMHHEQLLKMYRENINVLDYEPLVKICKYLSRSERPGRPSASEIAKVTGSKKRMSHYTRNRLDAVLTERYLLSVPKIGLRYRFVFTEKQKPGILSDGLIGKMLLSESNHTACTVHLEPSQSKGPVDIIPPNSFQLTADSELISLRLDLFDRTLRKWDLEQKKNESKNQRRKKSHLLRETLSDNKPSNLTERQLDLIGPTLSFRGLRSSRMWMMKQMGFAPRTVRRYLSKMLNDKVLRLLYMPALEYCGLPEGMIVVGKFKEPQSRVSFLDWLISRTPFVHVFMDKSTNLVACIRLPPYKTDVIGGEIREKLSKGGKRNRITSHSSTARLRTYKTYQMTVLQRLFRDDVVRDPWVN